MSEGTSIHSEVDVDVMPDLAFRIFTEELHCWWQQGAINFHDSSRAHHMAIEPRVGGRLIEVYDTDTGEGLELARVTVWEPGRRVSWRSSIDNVSVDVVFSETADGTHVSVTATLPQDGTDAGGTAWVRMTPSWLAAWLQQRGERDQQPFVPDRLAIIIEYADAAAAAKWLTRVFGLQSTAELPDVTHEESTWIEFRVGQGTIVLWQSAVKDRSGNVHTPWIFVDDVEALFAQIEAQNAEVLSPISVHGAKSFTVADLEGNAWTFAQASPRMIAA